MAAAGPSGAGRNKARNSQEQQCPSRQSRQSLDLNFCHHALAAKWGTLPFEAIDLDFAIFSPRSHWETRVRRIDVKLIYTVANRRFKTIEQKNLNDTRNRATMMVWALGATLIKCSQNPHSGCIEASLGFSVSRSFPGCGGCDGPSIRGSG